MQSLFLSNLLFLFYLFLDVRIKAFPTLDHKLPKPKQIHEVLVYSSVSLLVLFLVEAILALDGSQGSDWLYLFSQIFYFLKESHPCPFQVSILHSFLTHVLNLGYLVDTAEFYSFLIHFREYLACFFLKQYSFECVLCSFAISLLVMD